MEDRQLVLLIHNIRSIYNVGSLLRTSEGLGLRHVYITGYSPYPSVEADQRLPHIAAKVSHQINKTALGAELKLSWSHSADILKVIDKLKQQGYVVAGLEQTNKAINISQYKPAKKVALLIGSEVGGIDKDLLDKCDLHLQIEMFGTKDSFNASVATAIALYYLKIAA
jgi:23S rRNA (guanosine2251-2'-O)-methyltransferase